jgi:hypothetical protein
MQLPTIQRTILLTGQVFRASFLRPPELPPNASAAVAVVVAIWCNRPNDVLRGSSSRSGTAGLRISVWRISDLLLLQIAASLLALSIEGNTLTEYGVDVL